MDYEAEIERLKDSHRLLADEVDKINDKKCLRKIKLILKKMPKILSWVFLISAIMLEILKINRINLHL